MQEIQLISTITQPTMGQIFTSSLCMTSIKNMLEIRLNELSLIF